MITRRALLRGVVAVGATAATGSVLAACSDSGRDPLRLAAGEEGGFFWEFAQLTAQAAERAALPVSIVPVRTAGSMDNLAALASGDAELALSLADAAVAAMEAGAGFTAIGKVYENYMQLAVRADSGIADTSQLESDPNQPGCHRLRRGTDGRTDPRGAGSGGCGRRTRLHLSMTDAGQALRDDTVDAVLWAGGVPTRRSRISGARCAYSICPPNWSCCGSGSARATSRC